MKISAQLPPKASPIQHTITDIKISYKYTSINNGIIIHSTEVRFVKPTNVSISVFCQKLQTCAKRKAQPVQKSLLPLDYCLSIVIVTQSVNLLTLSKVNLGVRKSIRPVEIEWWGVGVVICLQQGADCLHMVQLMPLHPKTPSLASFIFRLVLPFWYRLTQGFLENRPLNVCSSSSYKVKWTTSLIKHTQRETNRRRWVQRGGMTCGISAGNPQRRISSRTRGRRAARHWQVAQVCQRTATDDTAGNLHAGNTHFQFQLDLQFQTTQAKQVVKQFQQKTTSHGHPQKCPFPWGIWAPTQYMIPTAHPSPDPKRHLDWLSHFQLSSQLHRGRDQQKRWVRWTWDMYLLSAIINWV